jgi:predicted ATPase/class 3 adenylate cyclase
MLFSDVEQSTLLLTRLGELYAEALDQCRRVQRAAWMAFGGVEMGTEGDSFFVVFPIAESAVHAAVRAQIALGECAWPNSEQVRVRMGIHTGTPRLHGADYVGLDVHRAARIAAVAHGGQVLVSDATAKLVGGALPAGVSLRDMGGHRLKDLVAPEHLYQLLVPGLMAEFPPLRSLGATSSVPVATTPMLGRDTELTELVELLVAQDSRLVTLTGPGGTGKTRLAIAVARQVAERFADGAFFVSLATLTSAEFLWGSIGEVLSLPPDGRSPPAFFEHVAPMSAVFLLDNLEQMDGAAAAVDRLLHEAPNVVVLATSRRALNLASEHQRAVAPLALPTGDTAAAVEASPAVGLFVARARAVRQPFALTPSTASDVVQICRRLDGLPLAIELVAARTKVFGPRALLNRLDQALDVRGSDADRPARHTTLRSTINWSYGLLSEGQRQLFRCLGVFAGGADEAALAAVCAGSGWGGDDPMNIAIDLVDASLTTVTEDSDGEPRFAMLETVRTFAVDALEQAGELADVRRRHAAYFVTVAERLDWRRVLTTPEQIHRETHLFDVELNNFREVLTWATAPGAEPDLEAGSRTALGLALLSNVSWLWRHLDFAEAHHWLETCIDDSMGKVTAALGRCLTEYAQNLCMQGELLRGRQAARRSVEMLRAPDDPGLPGALAVLGELETALGDKHAGRRALEESVLRARQAGDDMMLAGQLQALAELEMDEDNCEHSLELLREAVDLSHRGDGGYLGSHANHSIALVLRKLGRLNEAHKLMSTSLLQWMHAESDLNLASGAEDYSALLAEAGSVMWIPVLLGAADAVHEHSGVARDRRQTTQITDADAAARTTMNSDDWATAYRRGRNMTIRDALQESINATTELDA